MPSRPSDWLKRRNGQAGLIPRADQSLASALRKQEARGELRILPRAEMGLGSAE
ncbi:hypothetical protein GCM10023077_07950 [Mycolicibacterium helvum]